MALFDYPVTRPIDLSRWKLVVLLSFALLFAILITIFNIAATAYEPVSVPSTYFNNNVTLWYQRLIPSSWISPTWSCTPATLNLNDSISK
jgi:hypothetical protein